MSIKDELMGGASYEESLDFIKDQPSIEIPDDLHDIFLLDGISKDYRDNHFDYYSWNGIGVPRVTSILEKTINKDFLITWAANIGRKQYYFEKNKATSIGTAVHEMIEYFLLYGKENQEPAYNIHEKFRKNVFTGFYNFKEWLNDKVKNNIFITDIIAMEKVLTCPWFGGTADCICRINGKVYVIDFKTSKRLNYEYILQTCAYAWIINNGYVAGLPHVDGIGLIRVDKDCKNKYDDLFLNYNIPWEAQSLDFYTKTFGLLVESYYHLLSAENTFSETRNKSSKYILKTLGGGKV